jgi:hypothetical protein
MKYFLIVLFINYNGFSQTKSNDFESFTSIFPFENLPYNTSSLNKYKKYDSILTSRNILKNDKCIKYFFNGDKTQNSYKYESFNMETGEETGQKEYEYSFYPAFRLETKEWLMLGFLRNDMNDYRYYLALYKHGVSKIYDLIEINRVNEELLPDLFEYSVIEKNLNINIIKYELNPKYREEIKTKQKFPIDKTLITFKIFQLSKTSSKYDLVKTENARSKCSVSDFQVQKAECLAADPFQKLPRK